MFNIYELEHVGFFAVHLLNVVVVFIVDEYSGIYWSTYWFELRITLAVSRLTSSLARF